ncbi:MAG: kinase-like domain-containing protein, partial [Olpidium bornovanus]
RKKVIKFILKGRILVECWSKDPEIGVVPLEIRILHQLSKSPHPNIIEMKHFFQDANCFYIEMDLFGFGTDLFDYIELNRNMTEDEMKRIYLQTCLAVQHLHDRGIAHRDIKVRRARGRKKGGNGASDVPRGRGRGNNKFRLAPSPFFLVGPNSVAQDENLIVGENSHIRLIDFGSSAYVRSGKMFETFCGTLDYAWRKAPEVLEGCKYKGKPQDIWAMGILLYTLVYKENPFYNVDEIISGSLRVPFVVSAANLNLIRSILNRDPEKRPTIVAILEHEWLAGVKEELDFPLPGRGDDPPPPHRPRAA